MHPPLHQRAARQTFRSLPARAACVLLLLVQGCAAVIPAVEAQVKRPATVEDALSAEYIGRAEFSPDGRWLAYNLVPPYASLSDYSYWMRASGLSGHQLWLKDLKAAGPPRLQPGLDPAVTNFLFGMSPDSTRVVVMEHRRGRLRLAACRLGADDCVRFDPMPDIRDRYAAGLQWNERLEWVSETTFVMPVRRPDQPGSEMRSRGAAGTFLWEAWTAAWAGRGVTASEVLSTSGDRSDEVAEGALAAFDLSTGTVRILASGRHAGALASPDRRFLLTARVSERARPPSEAGPVARETHPIFDRRYALRMLDLGTGTLSELDAPFHVDPGSFTWRADSGAFAVFGWSRDEAPEAGQFFVFDRDTLRPVAATTSPFQSTPGIADPAFRWWPGPARAVLLEAGLIVHGAAAPAGSAGWFLLRPGRAAASLSSGVPMPRAELVAETGASVVALSEDAAYRLMPGTLPARFDLSPAGSARLADYRPDAEHAWSREAFPMPRLTRRVLTPAPLLVLQDAGGHDIAVGEVGPGSVPLPGWRHDLPKPGGRVLAASRAADAVLATFRDGAATRLVLFQGDGQGDDLARINSRLNAVAAPMTRMVHYVLPGQEGAPPRPVSACLLLPPGFTPSRRYPVLMELYPTGTGGDCRTMTDRPGADALAGDIWAARGFIYVRPPLPLDLARSPDDPLGRLGPLIDQTIDALAAEGYADADRVVIYGASQGGIAALVAAVQSGRPAAILSMNGWADYFSHYFGARGLMRYFHLDQNGGDNRWRYECLGEGASHFCPFGFGVTPLVAPELYVRASPVAQAARVRAPVFLVHSDFDYFDMGQYDEMFGALYRAGKEARYVRYWGEGHGLSSPDNIRDLWRRIDAFLEEHMDLAPVEQEQPPD
ncbi:prolyl oligopeptidase family serine peptidase [Hyphomonas sp.]|uniref:S9 family peptidase n=1 Tax=Hyphomonas sp. TaxID=87 RepID=UPI0025C259D5|nr:prolyl oligopeptidase family serine peptidase [Hyphomonas sp.]